MVISHSTVSANKSYRETTNLRMGYALEALEAQKFLPEKDRSYIYEVAKDSKSTKLVHLNLGAKFKR